MRLSSQSTVASTDPLSPAHVAVDESIVGAARAVGSIIAKHVETTERNRRLAPPVIDALRAAGLFRLFTPRALGGLEIDPVTFARVVEEVSAFDSAAGWAFQVNTGGDVAFLNGALRHLAASGRLDHGFIRDHTSGFEELLAELGRQS